MVFDWLFYGFRMFAYVRGSYEHVLVSTVLLLREWIDCLCNININFLWCMEFYAYLRLYDKLLIGEIMYMTTDYMLVLMALLFFCVVLDSEFIRKWLLYLKFGIREHDKFYWCFLQIFCILVIIGLLHYKEHLLIDSALEFLYSISLSMLMCFILLIFLELSLINGVTIICIIMDWCVCRYLKHLGYEVTYVRNFTDVDDKVRRLRQLFREFF